MAYKVTYAGLPLHDYIDILNVKRSILPPRENFVKDIPSQHGNFYMGYKYAPREITLECLLKANSREEYIENLRELAFILDVNVPTKMIIGDSEDVYCYAILDGSTDLEKVVNNGKFELKMICYDPYMYSSEVDFYDDEPLNSTDKSITLNNGGSTETYPILSVAFTKDAHFLQCTNQEGRTVLIGTPPKVDNTQGTFNPSVLKDSCEVLTNWNNVGNIIDDGIVDGDLVINGGGYGFTCTNFGSSSEGWHGGARRRNFDPVSDFRVEVKMEHNSKGDLNGTGSGSSAPSTSGGTTVKYEITASPSLRIRQGRGTSTKQVGSIPKGKIVSVSDIQSNWGKVTYNGVTGYISMEYTKKYNESSSSSSTSSSYKTTDNLRIRSGRGTNYSTLTTIPKGTTVTVTDIKDNWGKVTYNGKTGYSSMKYMTKVTTKIATLADEVSDVESCEDRMGKIEVYGFDQNGNKLFKLSMKDISEWYEYSEPEIYIGSKLELDDKKTTPTPKTVQVKDEKDETKTVTKKVDSGKYGDWNEFVGWFTIERKTENGKQKWKCKVEKINNEGKVVKTIESATLSDSSYPTGALTNIVVWFGKYKDNIAVDTMNVNEIYVTNIGTAPKPKENKPLFKNGDTLIIDFANQDTYLRTGANGSLIKSMMQHLDIGSEFFGCPVGTSSMGIRSDDVNINANVEIRKRWL